MGGCGWMRSPSMLGDEKAGQARSLTCRSACKWPGCQPNLGRVPGCDPVGGGGGGLLGACFAAVLGVPDCVGLPGGVGVRSVALCVEAVAVEACGRRACVCARVLVVRGRGRTMLPRGSGLGTSSSSGPCGVIVSVGIRQLAS